MVSQQEPEITPAEIKHRAIDWQERLTALYSDVQQWLPDEMGYQVDTSGTTIMNEELMKKTGVEPINLPTLKLIKNNEVILVFKPKGLWVIGANGRVDVFGKRKDWMLVDISERFAPEPEWKLADPTDRVRLRDFNREAFLKMLEQA